ncbi:MAG: hypothetical protein ACRDU4_03065 [Mycobacterium sp.]
MSCVTGLDRPSRPEFVRSFDQPHPRRCGCQHRLYARGSPCARRRRSWSGRRPRSGKEKLRVFQAMELLDPARVVFGQYEDYRCEPGVAAGSTVEPFAAAEVAIDNRRWRAVPFSAKKRGHGWRFRPRRARFATPIRSPWPTSSRPRAAHAPVGRGLHQPRDRLGRWRCEDTNPAAPPEHPRRDTRCRPWL